MQDTLKNERRERQTRLTRYIVAMAINYDRSDVDPRVCELLTTISFCLTRSWANAEGDKGGRLDPIWYADESWFGPMFVGNIRERNGVLTMVKQHFDLGLGYFCCELAKRFEPLLPRLEQWAITANKEPQPQMENLLNVFEFKRSRLAAIAQEEGIAAIFLQEVRSVIDLRNLRTTSITFTEQVKMGNLIILTGALCLTMMRESPH